MPTDPRPALDAPPEVLVDLVLPALDEEDAITWVVERVPTWCRPIVVDNGSTDATAELAARAGAVVVREPERGFGAACARGLAAATAPIVAFCDADGSVDPADLGLVVEPVRDGSADLVLGRRRPTGRGAWPVHARVANRCLARRMNARFGTTLHDLGPLRAARRVDLVGLDVRDRRFGWPLEQVVRAGSSGWKIIEVDVPYQQRRGRSKVTGTVGGTVRAVRDMRRVLAEGS